MSTILNTNGDILTLPEWDKISQRHCIILTAEWNPEVTHSLRQGAVDTLKEAGMPERNIHCFDVPGTVELVNAASNFHKSSEQKYPGCYAVITIGCVIRGDTPHFDYVCDIVSRGIAQLNMNHASPTIFGVLTVENLQQALDRAGGSLGNKGSEAAVAAIKMMKLHDIAVAGTF